MRVQLDNLRQENDELRHQHHELFDQLVQTNQVQNQILFVLAKYLPMAAPRSHSHAHSHSHSHGGAVPASSSKSSNFPFDTVPVRGVSSAVVAEPFFEHDTTTPAVRLPSPASGLDFPGHPLGTQGLPGQYVLPAPLPVPRMSRRLPCANGPVVAEPESLAHPRSGKRPRLLRSPAGTPKALPAQGIKIEPMSQPQQPLPLPMPQDHILTHAHSHAHGHAQPPAAPLTLPMPSPKGSPSFQGLSAPHQPELEDSMQDAFTASPVHNRDGPVPFPRLLSPAGFLLDPQSHDGDGLLGISPSPPHLRDHTHGHGHGRVHSQSHAHAHGHMHPGQALQSQPPIQTVFSAPSPSGSLSISSSGQMPFSRSHAPSRSASGLSISLPVPGPHTDSLSHADAFTNSPNPALGLSHLSQPHLVLQSSGPQSPVHSHMNTTDE